MTLAMKTWAAALLLMAVGVGAQAATITLDFSTSAAGSAANANASAIAGGITFDSAVYDSLYSPIDGTAIPGTLQWRVDTSVSTPVTIENTTLQGWGTPAAGSANALDARLSPILMHLSGPTDITQFGFTLANSTFGTLGGSFVEFLNASGQDVATLSFQQGVAGGVFQFTGNAVGVTDILLPSGTMYQNIAPVPLPAAMPLLLSGLALFGFRRRKAA